MTELLQALLLDIPDVLETQRLRLRAVDAGHGPASNAAMAESFGELQPWMPWAKEMQTPEQSEANARETRAKWLAREAIDYCWFRKDDGLFVGRGGLHTIEWAVPKFEIGYWVRTSCARQGYATEGTQALATLARDVLGARRLEITCDTRNLASRRVAEKCGFTLEGILRQCRRDNGGELSDACMYAKLS